MKEVGKGVPILIEADLPALDDSQIPGWGVVKHILSLFFAFIGIIAVAAFSLGFILPVKVSTKVRGTLEPSTSAWARAERQGGLLAVYARLGDTVRAGQAIAQLDSLELHRQLVDLAARIKLARLNVDRSRLLLAIEEKESNAMSIQAEVSVNQARAALRRALVEHGFSGDISQYIVGTHIGLDVAVSEVRAAEAGDVTADARRDRVRLSRIDAQVQEEELETMTRQRTALLQDLRRTLIKAPLSGVVISEQVDTLTGTLIGFGQPVLEIASYERWQIATSILEKDLKHIRIGDTAQVRFESLGLQDLTPRVGTVTSIGLAVGSMAPLQSSQGGRGYRVVISLADTSTSWLPDGIVRRGLSADVTIISRTVPLTQLLHEWVLDRRSSSQ